MKIRRILVWCLALCLAVGVMTFAASAAEIVDSGECGVSGSNLTWKLDDEGTLTISGEGGMQDYYNSTRSIAPWASYREEITSVIIENGAANIGEYTFYYCINLKSVEIPDSVTIIGDFAFSDCRSLTSVNIPNGVTSIGEKAFADCTRLTGVAIPDSIISIGGGAFYDCRSLTDLIIPDGLTSIGDEVSEYSVFSGCSSLKTVTIPTSVTYIAPESFLDCSSLETVYYFGGSDVMWGQIDIQEGNTDIENAVRIYEYTAPSITTPSKAAYAKQGKFVKASVEAAGTGELTYQWYIKNFGASKYSKSSVTSNTYSTKMSSASKDRLVYCVVTDMWGNTAKSDTVVLRMAATITKQPTDASAAVGSAAKTKVTAVGDGLTYTWYLKNPGAAKFSKSSVTSATYSCKMSKSNDGRQVYCVVKDKYGKTAQSNTVTLGLPVEITTQPKTTYTKQGAVAKTTVKADGDGLTYTWYIKNAGGTKYSKSSITSATYSVKMSSTSKGRYVYCIVKDKYGNSVKSNTVLLRMAATITTQPKSVMAAKGETAKVTLKAVGDGLKYTWYYKNAGAAKFTQTTAFTGNTYSVAMNAARDGRQIYCVVTDKYGKTAKTNTVTLNME